MFSPSPLWGLLYICTEPVFVNLLRSPGIDSQPGGTVRQPYLTYWPARLHRLAKLIRWNRFLGSLNNLGSVEARISLALEINYYCLAGLLRVHDGRGRAAGSQPCCRREGDDGGLALRDCHCQYFTAQVYSRPICSRLFRKPWLPATFRARQLRYQLSVIYLYMGNIRLHQPMQSVSLVTTLQMKGRWESNIL